jgi:cell division protein FtsQ
MSKLTQKFKILILPILLILLILTIILGKVYTQKTTQNLPIQHVNVTGNLQAINQHEVEKILMPLVNKQNFFDVNLRVVRQQLQGINWVASAEVTRIWPDTIAIHIIPQQVVAVINQIGLVNNYGEVFYPDSATFPANLPKFIAPNASDALAVLDFYQQMSIILQPIHLEVAAIKLNTDDSWEITLSNNVKLQLGDHNVLTRLHSFVKVYPTVFVSANKQAESVDMRYGNGMAVQWR